MLHERSVNIGHWHFMLDRPDASATCDVIEESDVSTRAKDSSALDVRTFVHVATVS